MDEVIMGPEQTAILDAIFESLHGHKREETPAVIRTRLSFLDGWLIQVLGTRPQSFVYDGKQAIHLNGNSESLYRAGREMGLQLDESNILDYVRFFSGFLRDRCGSAFDIVDETFVVLDADCNPYKIADPQIVQGNAPFTVTAYVVHEETLFRARYKIKTSGFVNMTDDRELGAVSRWSRRAN